MRVKILRGEATVLETEVTSLNIDENGYIDFYTPDNYYYTTTQGRESDEEETTLWLEMFEEDEDDDAIDAAGIIFSELKVFIMLNQDWIEVPQRDIFNGKKDK